MIITETFDFPLPPTLNQQLNLARTNRFKAAADKKMWTTTIAQLCHGKQAIAGKVWLAFTWRVQHRRHDADNLAAAKKYILDGLVLAKIIDNDNLTIIQSPVLDFYQVDKQLPNGVLLNISNKPMFTISPNF